MSKDSNDFSNDVEDIIRKTVEINKHYVSKSTDLLKQFSRTDTRTKKLNAFQPSLMADAFTAFTKLNLNHYENIMDLGFEFSKKVLSGSVGAASSDENSAKEASATKKSDKPSFILSETVQVGGTATLRFLLDNVKKDEANCELNNSSFINEAGAKEIHPFTTTFKPQSFVLASGASQAVEIDVNVGTKIPPGNYQSKVAVLGFEPDYFLIKLSVTKKLTKTTGDGRRKKKK